MTPNTPALQSFALSGKSAQTLELASGDIEIEGYCVVYDGLDAQGENFLRGALTKAIRPFLNGSAPLCWNHDPSIVIGRVLSLEEDHRGVKLRARLDYQHPSSPAAYYYNAVKRGSAKGLSIAGYFQRAFGGIASVLRLTEISLAGAPSHPLTLANAVEVKALMGSPDARLESLRRDAELLHRAHDALALTSLYLDLAALKAS